MNQKYDPNQFGTNEFMLFCRASGSQPYLAANVRSLPAEEFARWVEYCNAPSGSTTLAGLRAVSGDSAPFDVRYWAVGNEAWGCGGDFTPQAYAREFCRYVAAVPDYGQPLSLVASGPDKDDWEWTAGFFEEIARRGKSQLQNIYGFALHYYTWNLSRGRSNDFIRGKGDALRFGDVDWYELLRQGDRMESLIDRHWRIMGETDTQHAVKLVVDEWGSWYRPGSALTPENLFEQTPTLRDAIFSAITLDTFNRNADKVVMANCSQLINCLNSPYLAHENAFCVTPVGHVFGMYGDHQGGVAVRTVFSAPSVAYARDGRRASFWGLNGSASRHGKALVVTVTNPHVTQARDTSLEVPGATVSSGTMTTLTSADIHAHNTFEEPDTLTPHTSELQSSGPKLTITFPPASVTKLILRLE
jgi:alpha-N-arabinofuranosidase